jgi:hypothetical protein
MNIISILHTALVVYLLSVPFLSDSVDILLLHVAILGSIIFHWALNNDVCALTLLEQQMYPETKKDQLFVQRFVGPVYLMKNAHIHTATYALLLFTVYRYFVLRRHQVVFA